VILWAVFLALGTPGAPPVVGQVEKGTPAAQVGLQTGDQVIAVDGQKLAGDTLDEQITAVGKVIAAHKGTPVTLTVRRDGELKTVTGSTFYDKANKKWRFGFAYDPDGTKDPAGPFHSADLAVTGMWNITSDTVSHIAQLYKKDKRDEVGSVVGGFETTRQAIEFKTSTAFIVLAFISLSLGVINLFPFLPLDGGHIFWAIAEKVRGKAIPFSVMERAGFVGFALVIMLFLVGLTNDIDRLQNGGFGLR
jgi:regulator of sigma E protease